MHLKCTTASPLFWYFGLKRFSFLHLDTCNFMCFYWRQQCIINSDVFIYEAILYCLGLGLLISNSFWIKPEPSMLVGRLLVYSIFFFPSMKRVRLSSPICIIFLFVCLVEYGLAERSWQWSNSLPRAHNWWDVLCRTLGCRQTANYKSQTIIQGCHSSLHLRMPRQCTTCHLAVSETRIVSLCF